MSSEQRYTVIRITKKKDAKAKAPNYSSRYQKKSKSYTARLSPELEEHMARTRDDYYTTDEHQEIEDDIKYFGRWIWYELRRSTDCLISSETIKEIMDEDEPPEKNTDNLDLIKTLLTAEALKKDFDNVLLYLRFLRECYCDVDDKTGDVRGRPLDEHDEIKRWLHIKWRMYKKFGIYVTESDSLSENVWQISEPSSSSNPETNNTLCHITNTKGLWNDNGGMVSRTKRLELF